MCSEQEGLCLSPVTPVGISQFLSQPLSTSTSSECGSWGCNWSNKFLFIVFFFESVRYWPWKFSKPDEALALFMVDKLTNTDCSNPLQMCCSKLRAGCKQTKINIQDKNDRQHAASCQAPPQVMLRITILKHALNLERIAVLKCHFSRTSQILKVAN